MRASGGKMRTGTAGYAVGEREDLSGSLLDHLRKKGFQSFIRNLDGPAVVGTIHGRR